MTPRDGEGRPQHRDGAAPNTTKATVPAEADSVETPPELLAPTVQEMRQIFWPADPAGQSETPPEGWSSQEAWAASVVASRLAQITVPEHKLLAEAAWLIGELQASGQVPFFQLDRLGEIVEDLARILGAPVDGEPAPPGDSWGVIGNPDGKPPW